MKYILLLCLVLAQASCIKLPGAIDAAPAPELTRDLTVIFRGCSQKPQQGYLFCKLQEGANPKQTAIKISFPAETCPDNKVCAEYQFFKRDGTLGPKGSVKRENNEATIFLDQIIDSPNLTRAEDGEYQVAIKLWWVEQHVFDANGKDIGPVERTSRADGLVRVFVTKPEARPLTCNDKAKGWETELSKTCKAEFSTKLRTALCGSGC